MKNIFKLGGKEPKKIIESFLKWGFLLILLLELNVVLQWGANFTLGKPIDGGVLCYLKFQSIILSITTIVAPIIKLVLFKLICEIIYFFMNHLKRDNN